MKLTRGSEWRQWDLHLHTPSSYDYKDKSVSNEQIIKTLKDNDIRAVAITDHNVIDIDRIKELKRIAYEDITIFPGIELRSELGGSESVHFICIFPEDIKLETLTTKFIGKLDLTKDDIDNEGGHEKVYRHLADTVKIVGELGGVVTIHAGKKSNSVENLTNKLPEKIALKTDILQNVDIYEVGSLKDIDDYRRIVFPSLGKEIPTIICSDNHNMKNYERKQKLWIKADPTFEGLKQSIKEPLERFFVGESPSKVTFVGDNLNKFIDKVSIKGKSEADKWFDSEIELNHDLVTIIGNKGNGKSALADIIGYAGNAKNRNFSFLSTTKFNKKPEEFGNNYTAKISWKNGIEESQSLYVTDQNLIEKVKYLPQQYIEKACNDLSDEFKSEIDRLIFDYLPEEEKLKQSKFNQLIDFITKDLLAEISSKKTKLEELNFEIHSREESITDIKKNELRLLLENKRKDLEMESKNKPQEIGKPALDSAVEKNLLESANSKSSIEELLKIRQEELNQITAKKHVVIEVLEKINKTRSSFKGWLDSLNSSLEKEDIGLCVNGEVIVNDSDLIEYDKQLDVKTSALKQLVSNESPFINSDSNLNFKIAALNKSISEIKGKMSQTQIGYQRYLESLHKWELRITDLSKNITDLDNQLKMLDEDIPNQLDIFYSQRKEICSEIYKSKLEIKNRYHKKYKYIQERIEHLKMTDDEKPNFTINFDVDKEMLAEQLLGKINQNVKSVFRGKEQGKEELFRLIEDKDLSSFESIYSFISNVEKSLKESTNEYEKVFKDKKSFYGNLYSLDYVFINYKLNLGEKPLNQLSPGEKGLLLLIFYLILDKDNSPLIIDQPEDNLDNQSIYLKLVPYIKDAKQRRQIIIVTHNPNIAIACDSEQIIYSNMDKKEKQITYISGSIESRDINKHIVDVLEGTMPAFDKRSEKYFT